VLLDSKPEVTAIARNCGPEVTAIARNCGPGDKRHGFVFQDLPFAFGDRCAWKAFQKGPDLFRIRIIDPFELCPSLHQAIAHTIDVPVL
jgi:hypothetical protein